MNSVSAYKPRQFNYLGTWEIDEVQFKSYGITLKAENSISNKMLHNAKAYINQTLPAVRSEEGEDHKAGYIIIHKGEMATWLLVHWWAHNDIALRMLAYAPLGRDDFISADDRRFHACVWEHVVIDHERNAWVRTAMASPSVIDEYYSDVLDDGTH